MENLKRLLDVFASDQRVQQLIEAAKAETPKYSQLKGMIGAQDSFVLSAMYQQNPRTHLYIANDKETAAYIQNNLDNILQEKSVHFFPDSFKRPMVFEELDKGNVLQRTDAVNKLVNTKSQTEIVVTYPEALFEKVVDPSELSDKKIEIQKGEELDVDTMIEVLSEYGFIREDFVLEPGQFSIRGGIIDIFSYGNEWPYRIELFDEEVESIRTFDPFSQLSKTNIALLNIVPNINTEFQQDQKISLFKALPENAVVWINDYSFLLDRLQLCFEKTEAFAKTLKGLDEVELKQLFAERAFILPSQIIEEIKGFHCHFLSKEKPPFSVDLNLEFKTKPQTSFNKNFSLLIDHLKEKEEEGFSNYLFTSNPKQIERFYSIFEDMQAEVQFDPVPMAINEGFEDGDMKVSVYTDHQIFDRFHKYKLKKGFTRDQALNLKMLRELKPGDHVTHIDHGIGRYSGLEKIDINGHKQESVRLIYKNNDVLYVSINSLHKISKYSGKEGVTPSLSKIGGDAWKNLKKKTKRKVKDIARDLIKLYAKRRASKGHAFPPDGYLQNELEASFIYEDTPDQLKASEETKEDMQKEHPMDRLICGDVGFGKTEVAIRAAFKAVVGGKQVAVLVPTTILALQHSKTFGDRLEHFGVTVDFINRFKTTKEKKEIFAKLKEGKIDIVIGTHGLLNKEVGFKDLGLLIIDEEQKFGVAAKEKLRNLKVNVDTLTLTATPIPRTLQFSLMAARDLSIIRTPPPNRQPIHTERRIFNDEVIKDAIYYEYNRGGQVFFVHNRVKSLPDVRAMLTRLCPDVDIAMAHGKMESKALEKTLMDFINRKYDVLVCTNIIETGLDISNANTMIINNAHQFGMSDLHQLRGRVGRSNKKAFCYLFCPPLSVLTPEARKRIKTLEEFSDLGSGFNIAMRDLDIRGAGNLLGGEQSGFITDIGFETYQKILEEAIHELKENEYKDLFKEDLEKKKEFVRDVQIEADIEMLIPDDYINIIQERLNLYTELDQLGNEEDLQKFGQMLKDRFGRLPKEVLELFNGLRLRWICKKMGFERLSLKSRKLRCFFVMNAQSAYYETEYFNKILQFVSQKGSSQKITLKQSKKYLMLIKDDVYSLKDARKVLEYVDEEVEALLGAPAINK